MTEQQYYLDLGSWINTLASRGMLHRITRQIVKETELTSLVKLQFRGLSEDQRSGFYFANVINSKGARYGMGVATSIYAASNKMYALALQTEPNRDAIQKRWLEAQTNPIQPTSVSSGPVQDVVCMGKELLQDGNGLERLPIPVEVPGYSGQIRTTTYVVTKDRNTGWRNMGCYSGHVFGKTKILWEIGSNNHGFAQLKSWREVRKPMPVAIVIGGPPSFFYVAAAKLPYGTDELAVAGGLAQAPVELVKCKTIDLEVPAHAEIIIEGLVSPDNLEPGNAYGEFTGYMAIDVAMRPLFEVTCVTYRNNPTYVHIMSQFPPSESSKVRQVSLENIYLKFLTKDCGLPGVLDIAWHEMSQGQWCVIRIRKTNNALPWQLLNCAAGYDAKFGKFFIVVDEDIDANDLDSVLWALSWRVQPGRDTQVIHGRIPGLDLSAYRPDTSYQDRAWPGGIGSAAMLIDATEKFSYPPLSLPKRKYMEKALEIWTELGLPHLHLKDPWFAYSSGYWPKESEEDAQQVLSGDHYKIGEKLEKRQTKLET